MIDVMSSAAAKNGAGSGNWIRMLIYISKCVMNFDMHYPLSKHCRDTKKMTGYICGCRYSPLHKFFISL